LRRSDWFAEAPGEGSGHVVDFDLVESARRLGSEHLVDLGLSNRLLLHLFRDHQHVNHLLGDERGSEGNGLSRLDESVSENGVENNHQLHASRELSHRNEPNESNFLHKDSESADKSVHG